MSSIDVNREFSEFGGKMNAIAVLSLISFILGIVSLLIPFFGLVGLIIDIIIIIIFLLVLGKIKRVGRTLNNPDLLSFTPKFIVGSIIRFIGLVLWQIGLLVIIVIINRRGPLVGIGPFIALAIIGVVLIIIGSILRYMAWNGLETFFKTNSELFPPALSNNGKSGANTCKIATIFDMIVFLPLIAIIGSLIRIIGYFKLASLRRLVGGAFQPTYQPETPQPVAPPPSPTPTSANFCPICGTRVNPGINYCPECGSELN